MNNCAVILAGGEGTRMKSASPKVMAKLLFRPMIDWVIAAAKGAGIEDICVVTGFRADILKDHLGGKYETVNQAQRLGTGHAVMQAKDFIEAHKGGNVLILNGDAPLMDSGTISGALEYHNKNGFCETVISAAADNPFGYGRIVRDADGSFTAITEEASADEETKKIKEINSGAIWFKADTLNFLLSKLKNDNSKGEYYLTDTVSEAIKAGLKVGAFRSENPDAVLGANSHAQLFELNEKVRLAILDRFMTEGVAIPCIDGVIIDPGTQFGKDTLVLPGTIIREGCEIGSDCVIGPNTVLSETIVGDNCVLDSVRADGVRVSDGTESSPFSILF